MYKIISTEKNAVGLTEKPTYIKIAANGSYVLCSEAEATGIAHNGKPYHMLDRDAMDGLETVFLLEVDMGNELAATAVDVFCYRVAKYIGSYVAAMNGVDAIAFTAGIGENVALVRRKVCQYLGYLGIAIQEDVNLKTFGDEVILSTPESKVTVCVVPTNEELAIARETVALVK